MIWNNLNVLHITRQSFVSSESSEILCHALYHNVHSSGYVKFLNGDKVYYKRLTHSTWSGPAVVLRQDVQVLVKQEGIYVRFMSPCRFILESSIQPNSTKLDQAAPTSDTKNS